MARNGGRESRERLAGRSDDVFAPRVEEEGTFMGTDEPCLL